MWTVIYLFAVKLEGVDEEPKYVFTPEELADQKPLEPEPEPVPQSPVSHSSLWLVIS